MVMKCFKYNQHFVAMMNIINLARLRNVNGKFERHHIIPRCFYRFSNMPVDDSESNVVNLTSDEHIKVHQLAALCAKDIVADALLKTTHIIVHKRDMVNDNPSKDAAVRSKISLKLKGRTFTDSTKCKMKLASAKRTDRRSGFTMWFEETFHTTRKENSKLWKREYKKWSKAYG